MCGLVAVINKNRNGMYAKQQEIFASLLFIDYLRGPDSTGIFLVDNNGDVMVAKEASNPIDFMDTREFDQMIKTANKRGSALIGHNRKATRGDITDENAHPFVVDDKIILVHNGTMFGDHKKIADVEVDSHAIAHAIHESGNPAEALSSFDAAYALIWYNFETSQLNLIRNAQRPLWWMETHTEWIWASEKCMLDFVRDRHELKPFKGPIELTVNDLQKFTLQNSTWIPSFESLTIKKPWEAKNITNFQDHRKYQRHPYAEGQGWPDEEGYGGSIDDIPFSAATNRLRAALAKQEHDPPVQVETNGLNTVTKDFESELARKTNKIIPSAQFYTQIVQEYPQGMEVHAIAFDYGFANQKDDTGGYYLYLQIHDDPDVICRVWMDSKGNTEERMIQIAGTSYVYKLEVNRKWWSSLEKMADIQKGPATPGYCILQCDRPVIVYGGNMGDEKWHENLRARITH